VQAQASISNTFGETMNAWLNTASQVMKPTSVSAYYSVLEAHLLPALGDIPREAVSPTLFTDFLQRKSATLSPSTVGMIAAVLRHTLRYAEQRCLPIGCNVSAIPNITGRIRRDASIFSPREQAALESVLSSYKGDTSRIGVLLALRTGLRIGELCALRWCDINLQDGCLTVQHTLQRIRNINSFGPKSIVHLGMPKSASSFRTIPIPAVVLGYLASLCCESSCFLLSGTEKPVEPRTVQNRFKAYQREAKIEPINFHALRHTFATRWIEKGFDIKALSRVLGHSDVSVTLNIYVHPSMELVRSYLDQM